VTKRTAVKIYLLLSTAEKTITTVLVRASVSLYIAWRFGELKLKLVCGTTDELTQKEVIGVVGSRIFLSKKFRMAIQVLLRCECLATIFRVGISYPNTKRSNRSVMTFPIASHELPIRSLQPLTWWSFIYDGSNHTKTDVLSCTNTELYLISTLDLPVIVLTCVILSCLSIQLSWWTTPDIFLKVKDRQLDP